MQNEPEKLIKVGYQGEIVQNLGTIPLLLGLGYATTMEQVSIDGEIS